MNYKRKIVVLILIATAIRSLAACSVELGNDEVYYRMYAQYLQWNYFDHPPMVAWLIRFTTVNLQLDNEFFIRLGAIVSAAITTWLIFLCGRKLKDDHTGFLAAIIYTSTLYGSIIAGTFILPDSPQMICWSAGLYFLLDICNKEISRGLREKKLLWFGLVAGLGMLCKIHTSFLWFGFLLYIFFYETHWLKKPALYISGIITLLLFTPVIKWNIDNHFVTYFFHSKRVIVTGAGLNADSFLTFMGGQFFYYNPIIFITIIIAVFSALKKKIPILKEHQSILLLCSLPLVGIAFILSLFRDVLPHWTGPAYTGLILLAAFNFTKNSSELHSQKKIIPLPLLSAIILSCTIIISAILLVNYYPGTMGKKNELILGDGDFTLDMYGWKILKNDFEKIVKEDLQKGGMKNDASIITNKWFPASHIDYYIAIPLQKNLITMGDTSDIHQYAWINNVREKIAPGDDAYCLVPSENYLDVNETYEGLFSAILPVDTIRQKRNGKSCRILYVYKLKSYKGSK